jgi:hypothetical protein
MLMLPAALRLFAIMCGFVALTHIALGVSGDWIVGAPVASPIDPTLDSQNRFYGAAFGLYAALFWLSAGDLPRYATVLRIGLAIFFVAGCARLLAVAAHGWPAAPVIGLMISEIVGPPLIWFWLNRTLGPDAR